MVEASSLSTIAILGGSNQWFPIGQPARLICTSTGSSLIERVEWSRVDDNLALEVENKEDPGLLSFSTFKVFFLKRIKNLKLFSHQIKVNTNVKLIVKMMLLLQAKFTYIRIRI